MLRSAFELLKLKTKESEGNGIKDLKQALDKLQLAKKAAAEAEKKKKKEEENKIDVIPDPEANVAEKPPPCFRFYEYLHDKDPEKVEEKAESEKEAKEEEKEKPDEESGNPVEPVKEENPVDPDKPVGPEKSVKKKGKKIAKKLKIKINKKQLENLVSDKIGQEKPLPSKAE